MGNKLVWIDIETGGLHNAPLEQDENGVVTLWGNQGYPILEIGVIVTDENLNQIGSPYKSCIKLDRDKKMSEWSYNQFKDSLLLECAKDDAPALEKVEEEILEHLKGLGVKAGTSPLCGNSIRLDRSFIETQMMELNNFLHYRIIDVSSFKEIFRMRYDKEYQKQGSHRALDDIEESIEELRYYLSFIKEDI